MARPQPLPRIDSVPTPPPACCACCLHGRPPVAAPRNCAAGDIPTTRTRKSRGFRRFARWFRENLRSASERALEPILFALELAADRVECADATVVVLDRIDLCT